MADSSESWNSTAVESSLRSFQSLFDTLKTAPALDRQFERLMTTSVLLLQKLNNDIPPKLAVHQHINRCLQQLRDTCDKYKARIDSCALSGTSDFWEQVNVKSIWTKLGALMSTILVGTLHELQSQGCLVLAGRAVQEYDDIRAEAKSWLQMWDTELKLREASEDQSTHDVLPDTDLLLVAAATGDLEGANILIGAGMDVNAAGSDGLRPLHFAAMKGSLPVVKLLTDTGLVDVNAVDHHQLTPLHLATIYGHVSVAEHLIHTGADINAVNPRGLTPLHLAAMEGHVFLAEHLIKAGADINVVNRAGLTPVYLAKERGHTLVVNLLADTGL